MTVKYVIRSLHLLSKKNAVVLVLGILPIARQGKANGMVSFVRTRIRVSEVNFDQRKRNLVRVSGEYSSYTKKIKVTEK